MEDSKEKYLELLRKKGIASEAESEWLSKFREANPIEQYRLKNAMEMVHPVKPSRSQNVKEELDPETIKKQRMNYKDTIQFLEKKKNRYLKS